MLEIETLVPTNPQIRVESRQALQKFLQRLDIGFSQLPQRRDLWQKSFERAQELRKQYNTLAVVGVGGSSMGPRVLADVLGLHCGGNSHRLVFFDNVDGFEFHQQMQELDLHRTTWLVISKSGGTIETLTTTDFVSEFYQSKNVTFFDKVTVVSELRKNTLTDWAEKHRIPVYEIPVDVGGRYSVLTSVGLIPAAFVGMDLEKMRLGAQQAIESQDLVTEFVAQTLQSFSRDEWITNFWFYSSRMRWFGSWLQQLWSESLAKSTDRQGKKATRVSTPYLCIGSSDQHSFLQQVMEGARDKFVVFIRVHESESHGPALKSTFFESQKLLVQHKMGDLLAAEAIATSQALHQEKISVLRMNMQDLSPENIGFLFMFFQLAVATLGEYLDINAFDQPGVELGKRLAREILQKG